MNDGMSTPPSGEQYEILWGIQRATIVEVGGGIRRYADGGRDVLHPYPEQAMCDGAHGAPLVPWPNRLADGRYDFDGTSYQVALTEPDKHNAIHGFLRWRSWRPESHETDRVVMGTRLHPLTGYPFTLDVRVDYALSATGLRVETTATNVGEQACPYACGQHPYLSPGAGPVDGCTLELPAATRIRTDPERQLPTGTEPVQDTDHDFRGGHRIGPQQIDSAFTDLDRDADGLTRVRLTGADGRCVELWVDRGYPVVEIYTADTLAPERRRQGLGCEPMTGPPNLLRSGVGLLRLEPGASATVSWGVRLLPA